MKISVVTVFLLLITLFNKIANAQLVFTAADAKALSALGNVVRDYSNASITSANIGFPGGGNNWNFAGIAPTDSSTESIVAPSSTPYFSDFPTSNIVSFSNTFRSPYTTIVYLYEILKPGGFIVLGQEGTSNSDTSTLWSKLVDDSAFVVLPLPFTYNTRWGNKFVTHSTTIRDGVNNGTTDYPIVDSALVDAYGKITMPDGSFLDALRIRRVSTTLRPNGTYKTNVSFDFYTTGGYSFSVTPDDSLPPNFGTIPVSVLSWSVTKVKPAILVSKPGAGELVQANQPYNLSWSSAGITSTVRIDYSTDAGNTFKTIASGVAANAGNYAWNVPDALGAKCTIEIVDMADTTIKGIAGYFKIKGYVLTRINNFGNYEKFEPAIHGWQFPNYHDPMWPQTLWSQFNYKTGIDPYTNKQYPVDFDSTYPSNFPDWPLWVSIFTPAQCYIGAGGAYNGKTLLQWKAFSDSTFMGSCFGFSISGFLAFNFTNQFVVANPGIPAFTNLFDVSMNEAARSVINGGYLFQAGKQTQDFIVASASKDPRTTLQELKDMLLSDNPDIRDISIYNYNGTGGGAHSVAPYKLVTNPDYQGSFRLYVYDSNNPGDSTVYIDIDSLNNKWFDNTGLGNGTWQGNSHFYLGLPISNYLTTPILSIKNVGKIEKTTGTGNIEFYNSPNANVMYTSSTGKRIGLVDSTVTNEIPNAVPIFKITGHPSNPIGFYLPDDSYSIVLTNPHSYSGHVYVTTIKSNVVYHYERDSAVSTQTDRFKIDNGFSVASPDAANKLINLEVIAESDTLERIMFVNNTRLSQNDSLFTQQVNQSNFVLKNYGNQKTYDLVINNRSASGQQVFQYPAVILKANSTHTLVPDWSNLNLSKLKILVDTGNKGSNNDSLSLVNQYTGVNDNNNQKNIPNTYSLAQNYPNPFNPATTIKYQLQFSGRVTLKVYDILGREVATLVNEEKQAGEYSVSFNAGRLSSGIYFYTLQSGSFVETKKMLLIK